MGFACSIGFAFLAGLNVLRASQAQSADQATSGNYLILRCDAGLEGSMASDLQSLLPQIYNNLNGVIADATKGTASQHGFETFFHGNNNIAEVQKVYQSIAEGSTVSRTTPGRTTSPLLNLGYPTIVCLQPDDPETAVMYVHCEQIQEMVASRSDNFVALCPLFWEYPAKATIDQCPRVRRNTLTPNTDVLSMNQEAILVHELSHMYGVVPLLSWQEGTLETYTIGDAAKLDEQSALRNGPSFGYYYSGKSLESRTAQSRSLTNKL